MWKRILSSFLMVIFLIGILVSANPFYYKASALEYREGFSLTPLASDSTGVSTESKFLLNCQKQISLEKLKESFSIEGEPTPEIRQMDIINFVIIPSRELDQNKIYTFKLDTGDDQITWAFQTSATFRIMGSFPGDQTTGVPKNTGIEIYFSHEDYNNIDNYFEISPKVEGAFERHKRAAVFVPKDDLKEGTLYTITIKKGLKLKNSKYSLKEDYSFKFETGKTTSSPTDNYKGYFSYNKRLNEFSPREKPHIPFYYYINENSTKSGTAKVQTTVYGYKNIDSFITALGKKDSIPSWAYMTNQKNLAQTTGLNKVLNFDQEFKANYSEGQFIKIPQALPAGYYVIDSKWDTLRFQTFIQVTDIGMYIMKSDTKSLVWLNDLGSKAPSAGATLSLTGSSKGGTYTSDSNGLATFETPEDEATNGTAGSFDYSNYYFKVTAKNGKTAVLSYESYFYRYYGMNGSNLYWNFLSLDRNLYKPDDTVSLWGFAKNRYSNEKLENLTVEISQGYSYWGYGKGIAEDSIRHYPSYNAGQPLVKTTVDVQDGAFQGSLKLPNLDPGGYQLTVKKGATVLANSYVNVQNYTKPPYKVEISRDKEAIFAGEQVIFDIKASFFEGTGLPDLGINYNIYSGIDKQSPAGNGTTNSKGNLQVKYTPNPIDSVQGEQSATMSARATLPEIGQIYQNSNVRVFVNDINVALTTDIKDSKKTISAQVNKIVLDRLNNGTAKDYSDYLGNAVSGKKLSGTIYRNTWVKVEDGTYYDFINKVTSKSYRYDLKKESIKTFSMTTGDDGKASFDFEAADLENGYYTAEITCTDNSGRNMSFNQYISKGYNEVYYYNDNMDDNRYYLDGGKESYNMDESVELTFKKGKTALAEASKNNFMFIKTQNGIREYSLKNAPNYSFKLSDKDIPNVYVTGVYFNGITYIESEILNVAYNYKEKDLVIDAKTDKASYKPGEEVIVKITAKDKKGNPKKSIVNERKVNKA